MNYDPKKLREMYDTAILPNQGDRTLKSIFNLMMERNKNRVSTIYFNDNNKVRKYTFKRTKENSIRFAEYIDADFRKIKKNTIVILKMANGPHWCEILWATLMSGYRALLVDAKTSFEGVMNLAKQAKCEAIITDDSHRYTEIRKLRASDIIEGAPNKSKYVGEWADEIIFCSSGTTGNVKMMIYSGESLCGQIAEAFDVPNYCKDNNLCYPKCYGDLRNLAMIPFHHVFGLLVLVFWYQWFGGASVYPASNMPSDLLNACQAGKVTHILSVPLLWESIATSTKRKIEQMDGKKKALVSKMIEYRSGKITKEEAGIAASPLFLKVLQKNLLGTKIRFCITGGGAVSLEAAEFINAIGYPLHNGYGMTEVGVASVNLSDDVNDRLTGNIGTPFYGVEYKIAPTEEGGNTGELLIRSKAMHIRTIIGGVESPAQVDEEGYFHSGDIASQDENGMYYIKGRIKDVIINSNGENIFPDELELYFRKLEHVTHYSVLGVKNPKGKGEDVILVLEVENTVTQDDLDNLEKTVKEIKLPHNVVISRIYLSKAKLPTSNNMKIKRFAIKKSIEENTGEYRLISSKEKEKALRQFDKNTIEKYVNPIKKIFSEVLVLPEFKIEVESHWINDLGGDSMNYVEMIQKVQETYNITFDESLHGQMTCLADIVTEAQKAVDNKK